VTTSKWFEQTHFYFTLDGRILKNLAFLLYTIGEKMFQRKSWHNLLEDFESFKKLMAIEVVLIKSIEK
jgi:hypothetical protein